MRTGFISLAIAVAMLSGSTSVQAQYPYYPYPQQPRTNPDMMAPGGYGFNPQGAYAGPSCYVAQPYCPYVPNPYMAQAGRDARGHGHGNGHQNQAQGKSYLSQPFVRSPRDFFMFHENLDAERSRDLRPQIVP